MWHFGNVALDSGDSFITLSSQFLRSDSRILSDLIFYPFIMITALSIILGINLSIILGINLSIILSIILGINLSATLGNTLCRSLKCHHNKATIDSPCWCSNRYVKIVWRWWLFS